jgi:hypothetical protein
VIPQLNAVELSVEEFSGFDVRTLATENPSLWEVVSEKDTAALDA